MTIEFKKTSELDAADGVDGEDELVLIRNGLTCRAPVAEVALQGPQGEQGEDGPQGPADLLEDDTFDWNPSAYPNGRAQSVQKTIATSDNTPTAIVTFAHPTNCTIDYTATVVGRKADGSAFTVDLRATFSRGSGGIVQDRNLDPANALGEWASAVIDNSGNTVRVMWTGPSGSARATCILNGQRVDL